MDPSRREGWPAPGPAPTSQGNEQAQSQGPRPLGGFGPGNPGQQQQSQPPQSGAQVLPPPSAPYYPPPQSAGPNLPGLHSLTQQAEAAQPSQQRPSNQDPHTVHAPQQQPAQGGGYPLPGINQTLHAERQREMAAQQPGVDGRGPPQADREREMREQRQHMEELMNRDAELRERELRERQQQEQAAAHENHAGPIHLHQPVAVPPQVRAIHGPNGLLGSSGPIQAPATLSGPLNALGGHGNSFPSGPVQAPEGTPRMQQAAHPTQQQQVMVPFGGGPNAMQQAQMGMGQGQQPILNDALSYLDQVKVQFVDHPDVYNRFLDIMKDFKSGAIDTPGVIERVSHLFAGHPNLIQGFNTFLPPGYKIECGTSDDPNAIRVTTPMGTTVSSMPAPRPLSPIPRSLNGAAGVAGDRAQFEQQARENRDDWRLGAGGATQNLLFSPGGRAIGPQTLGPNGQPISPEELAHREQQAALAHQQQERGVAALGGAVSAAAAGGLRGNVLSPAGGATTPPLLGQALNGFGAGQQAGLAGEKRGPVEFNHAISYVNKIKNRFQNQPDIYKQFLEILQTYQRESKPIQDVYVQVTSLFKAAPDLLEDFKQFLPESAAQHRASQQRAADGMQAMTSQMRDEPAYAAPGQQLQHTPRPDERRLPPVGNFAPTPSANRDNKRKRGDRQGTAALNTAAMPPATGPDSAGAVQRGGFGQPGSMNKRAKQQHSGKQPLMGGEVMPVSSPTLTPALPEPMPPRERDTAATPEELAFFDRVKKFIANKNTMNEFLKLCNLFSQDLIDKNLLFHRAQSFIGGNPELLSWFKRFLGYEGEDKVIENRPKQIPGKVQLANCRGLGPSYRLLPKRERLKPCSGRDELCNAVLNDEWASHPTWASEDSGFVAHRKNIHEEGLHRIEEERHDYDFNIQALDRTVQQLEPIAQKLLVMPAAERQLFQLPPGLGGQSETIYKRVIMKIYGRDRGKEVIESLLHQPAQCIPVLLNRMKQKLEEWKAAQREWEKVWREQTQKIFWKSLDHQSISAKQADKRQFQTKTLQNEIQVKYEEQKRQREINMIRTPKYQFLYKLEDLDVLQDGSRLILALAEHQYPSDYPKLSNFVKEFVPLFFGLDAAEFSKRVQESFNTSPPNEYIDTDTPAPEEGSSSRAQKGNAKNNNLLRGVLDRGRKGKSSRHDKEDSASGSRGSTPDASSAVEEEMAEAVETPREELANIGSAEDKWLNHPIDGNLLKSRTIDPKEPYKRSLYNMYCNLPIYCFFRMFVILYERLSHLKQAEEEVHEAVRRAKLQKPALDLGLVDRKAEEFFSDTSASANYYSQILDMFEQQITGNDKEDMTHIEETLRRYYLQTGWQLYSFDRLLAALVRFAVAMMSSDPKDKTWDIYQLFKKDRVREETTHDDELNYRKQVEKYTKDGDIYRITFDQPKMSASVQIFKKEDSTFNDSLLPPERKWAYYVAAYTSIDPTEGFKHDKVSLPYLRRNAEVSQRMAAEAEAEAATSAADEGDNASMAASAAGIAPSVLDKIASDEKLEIRIELMTYGLNFAKKSEEYFVKSGALRLPPSAEDAEHTREERDESARESTVVNNKWMKGLSKDRVDERKKAFQRLLEGEVGVKREGEDEGMADV